MIVPAFTAVPTAAAVCATGAVPVFVDVDPDDRRRSTRRRRAAALTDRTRAVIPVHLYGRPAVLPDLGVPVVEDAAQAHGALDPAQRSAAVAYSFYPTKNLGGISDGGAVSPTTTTSRRRSGCCARTASPTTTCTPRSSTNARLSEIEAAALRVGLPRVDAGERPPARDRGALPRRRARPALAGRAPAARVPPVRRPGPRSRRLSGSGPVRHRRALPAGAHAAARVPAVRAIAVPGSGTMGGGVRIVPVLSRADRRRDRGGVSSDPVNPAVEAVSVFFPCYNDEATIASMVELVVATIGRVGVDDAEVIVVNDGSTDGSAAVLDDLDDARAAAARRHPRAQPRATAARCCRGSRRRRSSGSSTPTATGSSTPPSSSCSCSTRPTTSTWCRATSCAAPTACSAR